MNVDDDDVGEDLPVDPSVIDDTATAGTPDLVRSVALTLLEARELNKLPARVTDVVANTGQMLICKAQSECTKKVLAVLKANDVGPKVVKEVESAMLEECKVHAAVTRLDKPGKLERYVASNMAYIAPEQKRIGVGAAASRETFQVVSITETLKFLLSFDDVLQDVLTGHQTNSGVLRDVVDGEAFRQHPLFSQEPNSLAIIFYMDEFTVTNPLRGRAKFHKIMAGYYTLANIPPQKRSQLKAIQLALLCASTHIKTNGLEKVMVHTVKELKDLTNNGLDFTTSDGTQHHFSCQLFIAVGDNLGAHQMGGFMEGFGANLSCRFCMVDKEGSRAGAVGVPRTPQGHDIQVETVRRDAASAATYGVKKRSIFAGVSNFSPVGCLPSDLAHDIFEGVLVSIVTVVLERFLMMNAFNREELNDKILRFPYIGTDKVDRRA